MTTAGGNGAPGDAAETRTRLPGWWKDGGSPGSLEDCTLILATYRRPREILALLTVIAGFAEPPGEVVIVDGSPDDESATTVAAWAAARDLPFELRYIRSPAGLTRQRNVGIDASTRDLVFFLDDDCIPEPGYFRAIRDVYRADAEQVVGGVAGALVSEMQRPLSLRWRLRLALRLAPRGECLRYYPTATSVPYSLATPFTGVRRVDMMPGCAMSFRRAALERHRFSMFFYGYANGEDLEMSMRVGREYTILCCGDARARHEPAQGGRPPGYAKGRMEVRNRVFIWLRYSPDPPFGVRVRFWLDVGFALAYDVAAFLARPWRPTHLARACGMARGILDCWIDPPRFVEPTARREYEFALAPLVEAARAV